MVVVYAGLHKMSCDMCGELSKPKHIVIHKDRSKADICSICYGKCLAYPKFNEGIKAGDIKVIDY